MLVNTGLGDKLVVEQTDELLSEAPDDSDYVADDRIKVIKNMENFGNYILNTYSIFS